MRLQYGQNILLTGIMINVTMRQDMKLVIIIPALNEAKTIGTVIQAIPKHFDGINQTEIIVVDDGSTDQTVTTAQHNGATVVRHQQNMGVGAAFHTGIRAALEADADIIVNIDADGQFNPLDISTLIKPIQNGTAGFVTASRFAKKEFLPDMPAIKKWGNMWMTRIINILTGQNFTDVSCGFRAYSRDTALQLTLFGHFTYTQETFIDLTFKRVAMLEVPLKIRGEREFGTSRVASNLWRYGTKAATIIFRAARDYYSFYFFGIPGVTILGLGILIGLFLAYHYYQTGQTSPYRSLVAVSGVLMILGLLFFFLSMLADMLHRNRLLLDETLYLSRKAAFKNNAKQQ